MTDRLSHIRDLLAAAKGLLAEAERCCDVEAPQPPTKEGATESKLPCEECAELGKCEEPCKKLEKLLVAVGHGRGRKENLTGLYPKNLRELNRERLLGVFAEYESCQKIFSDKQWAVIKLRFGEGKTQAEIRQELGLKRSSVNDLLRRARRMLEEHQEKLRKEKRGFRRG